VPDIPRISIDPALVERYILELATHGAVEETGVSRPVYSPAWVTAQQQAADWAREAGLAVQIDAVGNLWGRLVGSEPGPSIVSGSHLDSQCPGGRYDGALGVIAALIAVRALREQLGQPRRTLEVLAFCEEESSRFPATNFWGSRAITGRIAPGEAETLVGYADETIAQAMRAIGLNPARIPEARRTDIDTFIELHIEQGPILEQAALPVGIVSGFPGIRHYVVDVRGKSDHAGAMPMDLRRDPMAGAAEIISGVIGRAVAMGRPAVTTVGRMLVEPNFPAIVPERVSFTIDARHPDPALRAEMYAAHEEQIHEVAFRRRLDATWHVTTDHPPQPSDAGVVETLEASARALGIPHRTMPSGAVHDCQRMAQIAKVAMIFVQSKDGRSHTPAEFTSVEHATAGVRVLAEALRRLAY
jgi:allantoate deiminase